MTTPATRFRAQSALFQQLTDKLAGRWVKAGDKSDSAEGLGIDGRIALVHDLVDLWLTGWATVVEFAVKGPGLLGISQATEPLPSEPIDVPVSSQPRQIQVLGPFVRVGLPEVSIPESAIGFTPAFLPPGVTQFRLILKDYRYVGANYTGKIKVAAQNVPPFEKLVTVGL